MPVTEDQEPQVPTSDESSAYGTFDPTEHLRQDDEEETPPPSALFASDGRRLPTFDARHKESFEGLVFLGALTHTFQWLGHTFVIRTVTSDELLAVAQIIKPWQGTIGESRAYATAMAAMSVVSVDGQALPIPIGESPGASEYGWAYQRFNHVKARWFPFTQDKVYSEYMALDAQAAEVVTAMEKAYGSAGSTAGSNAASAGPSDRDS